MVYINDTVMRVNMSVFEHMFASFIQDTKDQETSRQDGNKADVSSDSIKAVDTKSISDRIDRKTVKGHCRDLMPDTIPKVTSNLSPCGERKERAYSYQKKSLAHNNLEETDVDVVDYKVCAGIFAKFRLNVRFGKKHWTIHRRYRDFAALYRVMRREFPVDHRTDLQLPPRRLVTFNKFDSVFLARRTKQLDLFAKTLIRNPNFLNHPLVLLFFSTSWTLVYNFEDTDGKANGELLQPRGGHESESLSPREMKRYVEATQGSRKLYVNASKNSSSSGSNTRRVNDISNLTKKRLLMRKPSVPYFHEHVEPVSIVDAHPRLRFLRGEKKKVIANKSRSGTPARVVTE